MTVVSVNEAAKLAKKKHPNEKETEKLEI